MISEMWYDTMIRCVIEHGYVSKCNIWYHIAISLQFRRRHDLFDFSWKTKYSRSRFKAVPDNITNVVAHYTNIHNSGRYSFHRKPVTSADFCCHQFHVEKRNSFREENLEISTRSKSSHFIFSLKSCFRRFQELLLHLRIPCNWSHHN